MTITALDYVKYFFFGYKIEGMNQTVLSVLRAIQYGVIVIIAAFAQNIYDNFAKGNYALDLATLQGYIMPGVVLVLGFLNELLRKYLNPSVSLKTLPQQPSFRSAVQADIPPPQ